MKYCFLALFFLSQNLFAMSNPGKPFGQTPAGESVTLYTLKNAKGMEVHIMNYGGIIQKILTPDRTGKLEDVVLGFETLEEYIKDTPYFGAIVGRFGNRIAAGKFTLDGKE
jgi:aldose 1-epimerase